MGKYNNKLVKKQRIIVQFIQNIYKGQRIQRCYIHCPIM